MASPCLSDDWHHYVLDDCWGNTALKMDSQDLPCILYDVYGGLRIAHYTGTEWEYEDIYGTDYGGAISLALDSQDRPHISYHQWTPEDLMYCHWDESQWVIELVDDEEDCGLLNSIALDSSGYPHIAYKHYISGESMDLRYAYKDEEGWHTEVVDDEHQFQGTRCSLVLDSQDHPHISYQDSSNRTLKYAHWDGNKWIVEEVDSFTVYPGVEETSIAIDSQDRPHIAYFAYLNLYYAHWDGNDWLIDDLDDCCGDVSIALDSQEYPNIAYCYDYVTPIIRYAHWNGSQWEFEDTFYDPYYFFGQLSVSLDLDSLDKPHIICDESPYVDVWYIWYGDPLTEVTLDHFSAQAEGSAIAINWTVETTPPMAGGENILGFNLYRREINNNIAAEVSNLGCIWTKVNTGLITGENPYTYTDSDVESGVAYEYKLEAVLADDSPETLGTTQATAGLPPAPFAILALYPNPASDYLTCLLAVPEGVVVKLSLHDLSGRLVLKQQLEPTEPTELEAMFDVSGLASGVYTLRASYDGAEESPACGGVAVVVR